MVTRRPAAGLGAAALALAAAACGADDAHPSTPRERAMSNPELEIVVDVTHVREGGYGHTWQATVREVRHGALADATVQLSTVGNDRGGRYGGHFRTKDAEAGVTLLLERVATRPPALAGFVATDGTIWRIVDAK